MPHESPRPLADAQRELGEVIAEVVLSRLRHRLTSRAFAAVVVLVALRSASAPKTILEADAFRDADVPRAITSIVEAAIAHRLRLTDIAADARGETDAEAARLRVYATIDGPVFEQGRSEGRADVATMIREVIDPDDTDKLNLDGLIDRVRGMSVRIASLVEDLSRGDVEVGKLVRMRDEIRRVLKIEAPPIDGDLDGQIITALDRQRAAMAEADDVFKSLATLVGLAPEAKMQAILERVRAGWSATLATTDPGEQPITKLRQAYDALVAENLALARALGGVAAAVKGYRWIPAGEWGPFPAGKRTARTLRREASECFAEVLRIVDQALRASASRLDAEAQGGRRG